VHGLFGQHLQDRGADIAALGAPAARPTSSPVTMLVVAMGTVLTYGVRLAAGLVVAATFASAPLPEGLERASIPVSHLFSLY
jgi:hypothetical protein